MTQAEYAALSLDAQEAFWHSAEGHAVINRALREGWEVGETRTPFLQEDALNRAARDLYEACRLSQEVEVHYRFCEDCDQDDGTFCEAGLKLAEEAEHARVLALAKAQGNE